MRDILIVVGMCVLAIGIGASLYAYGPKEFQESAPAASTVPVEQEPIAPSADGDVMVTVVAEGSVSGVEERKNVAVYAEEELDRLWEMAGMSGEAIPQINFEEEYVIAAFAGTKSTGGHTIAISEVRDEGTTRTVSVTLTAPGAGCMATQAITNPYQIVRVPHGATTLVRNDIQRTQDCE